MKKWGHRGSPLSPIPYLGEKQIDRGNNDKLQNIISNSGYNVQTSIILRFSVQYSTGVSLSVGSYKLPALTRYIQL
jgi:hypothetical protein